MTLILTLWLASGSMRQFEVPASDCLKIQANAAAGWTTEFDDVPTNSTDHVIKVTCEPTTKPEMF